MLFLSRLGGSHRPEREQLALARIGWVGLQLLVEDGQLVFDRFQLVQTSAILEPHEFDLHLP